MRGIQGAACLVSALLLSGCIERTAYPDTWPKRVASSCASVAGVYANAGVNAEAVAPFGTYNGTTKLAYFSFPQGAARQAKVDLDKADRVTFVYDRNVMTVEAFAGEQSLLRASYSERDRSLHCTKDGATIDLVSGGIIVPEAAGAALASSYATLSRTEDGSLAVRHAGHIIGVVFGLVPMTPTSVVNWGKFPPYVETKKDPAP
jgi:hypothetical protein